MLEHPWGYQAFGMRNLLQFLVKYSNFLLFMALEIAAFVLLFRQNAYQRSVYVTSANAVSGEMYAATDRVYSYLHLTEDNEALARENARLLGRIAELENLLEPQLENDSTVLYPDCDVYRYSHKGLTYIPAKVINTESGKLNNCLTLNKGLRDGVEVDMGVVGQSGVVGIVMAVSEHFSMVLPLDNKRMSLSCRFKKDQTFGPLEWDGLDYRYSSLNNIARHAEVRVGDTVVTSGLTTAFPEGVMVGVVEEAVLEESDAYYHIKVRLATNFRQIGYVQVVSNETLREQQEFEDY